MTVPSPSPHTSLVLDAEALYAELRRGVQALLQPHTQLVGIASGGAWLAERLHRDLGLAQPHSSLSSSLHRDDFAQRGLAITGNNDMAVTANTYNCSHEHTPWLQKRNRGPAVTRGRMQL